MAGSVQDDIRKFQLEINAASKNGETLAQLTKLEKETSKLRNENTELQKVMAHLAATKRKNTDEYKRMEAQLKANRKTIRQNSDEMKGLMKNLDLNYMSMGQLKKRAGSLKSTLNSMSKAANPKEYDRLEKELKQVGAQMDKLRGKSNKTKNAFKSLLPALGVMGIISGIIAIGKQLFNAAKATYEFRRKLQQLTQLSGPELVELTAKIQATANTFKVDLDKLSIANHNFAESMSISEKHANDLINKGFIAGADASGEFLDKLREYGPQFKAAGISAEEAIAIMTQEVRSGIYSDKGTDAIKEATVALREMPKTARDAVDAIGLSSKEMMKQLESGEISVFEAIQKVSKKMGELPPQSAQVGQAMADIFKGAGEDAGLDYILMLGDAQESMDDLIETAGEAAEANEKMLEANTEMAEAWNDMLGQGTAFWKPIWASTKFYLAKILKGFSTYQQGGLLFIETMSKKAKAILKGDFDALDQITEDAVKKWNEIKNRFENEAIEIEVKTGPLKGGTPAGESPEEEKQRLKAEEKKRKAEVKLQRDLLALRKKHGLVGSAELLKLELEDFEKNNASKLLSTEEYFKAVENIMEKHKTKIKSIDIEEEEEEEDPEEMAAILYYKNYIEQKKRLDEEYKEYTLEELEAATLAEFDKNFALLKGEKEFQEARKAIQDYYADLKEEQDQESFANFLGIENEKLEQAKKNAAEMNALFNASANLVGSLQEYEANKIQEKVDKGLISEEEGEKEKKKMLKKYADVQFIATAGQIISSTALAIMQAWAMSPIIGGLMTPIIGATGALQLAIANQERQRVKQMYTGGYTGLGNKYEEVDAQLHKDEYVIPSEGVNNPNIRPFIRIMEQQRVAGNIGQMGMPMVQPRVGGYQPVNSSGPTPTQVPEDNDGFSNSMEKFSDSINQLVEEGVNAWIPDKTTRDMTEAQVENQMLLNQTSR